MTEPLFRAQYDLMMAAHCGNGRACQIDSWTDVMSCLGDEPPRQFFGLELELLGQEHGFADFLYTMADRSEFVAVVDMLAVWSWEWWS